MGNLLHSLHQRMVGHQLEGPLLKHLHLMEVALASLLLLEFRLLVHQGGLDPLQGEILVGMEVHLLVLEVEGVVVVAAVAAALEDTVEDGKNMTLIIGWVDVGLRFSVSVLYITPTPRY